MTPEQIKAIFDQNLKDEKMVTTQDTIRGMIYVPVDQDGNIIGDEKTTPDDPCTWPFVVYLVTGMTKDWPKGEDYNFYACNPFLGQKQEEKTAMINLGKNIIPGTLLVPICELGDNHHWLNMPQ